MRSWVLCNSGHCPGSSFSCIPGAAQEQNLLFVAHLPIMIQFKLRAVQTLHSVQRGSHSQAVDATLVLCALAGWPGSTGIPQEGGHRGQHLNLMWQGTQDSFRMSSPFNTKVRRPKPLCRVIHSFRAINAGLVLASTGEASCSSWPAAQEHSILVWPSSIMGASVASACAWGLATSGS